MIAATQIPQRGADPVETGRAAASPQSQVSSLDPLSVLWIDDELDAEDALLPLLAFKGVRIDVASSGHAGLAMARPGSYDAIMLDLRLPDLFGMTVLDRLIARDRRAPIVVVSGYYLEPEIHAEAARRGAATFLHKPFLDPDALAATLRGLVRHAASGTPLDRLPTFGIVAVSETMRIVADRIRRIGPTHATVLITGETGTGKDLVAHALHQASTRRSRPFVPVNCAAIPEALVESEFFGHRKGAFTGALNDHKGLFEAADGGTLFLDEIGDLPLVMQARLLRCLDNGEVRRVGETRATRVDVRIIAATHRSLPDEIVNGRFRADLYYRLSVTRLHLPPLRERPEDVEVLLRTLLTAMAERLGMPVMGISQAALGILRAHRWPGNVRELRHVLERALLTGAGELLTEGDVSEALTDPVSSGVAVPPDPSATPRQRTAEVRRLFAALEEHHWNRSQAARDLGISRSTLWRALRRAGFEQSLKTKS